VRRARRTGYAAEAVENTFVYIAIYDGEGLGEDRLQRLLASVPQDVIGSGILPAESRDRNPLVINTIPEDRGGAQLFLPYFLYSLPKTSIIDILRSRMLIIVFVNPAQIARALEVEGFRVTNPAGRNDLSNESFVVETTFRDDDGYECRAELHNLKAHIDEMVMEFRSVSYIVTVAKTMRAALRQRTTQDAIIRLSADQDRPTTR
jgi:hypothetical protein